jgi:hypothetical protein
VQDIDCRVRRNALKNTQNKGEKMAILTAFEIANRQRDRIEELLRDNAQAYFEITGSPGVPPLSSLGPRLASVVQGDVSSFAIDGTTVLRVSWNPGAGDVCILYSLLTGGDLEAKP